MAKLIVYSIGLLVQLGMLIALLIFDDPVKIKITIGVVIVISIFIIVGIIIHIINKKREEKLQQIEEEELKNFMLENNIEQIDSLNPYEFEEWVTRLMILLGYDAYTTKASGDYGLDVIAKGYNGTIGIQVKMYDGHSVGVKVVQEVLAGMRYYNCDEGWVITTAYSYTKAAINMAETTGVDLFTKDDIEDLLNQAREYQEELKNNVSDTTI